MSRFRRLDVSWIRAKGSSLDLVTEADEAAERVIAATCARLWPEALVIGEESTAPSSALSSRLSRAGLAIVVDPIDGTANFAAGLPLFAVIAAVVSRGKTVAGIIHDPLTGGTLYAEKGAGGFVHHGGERRRARVAEPAPLGAMIGTGPLDCFPPDQRREVLSRIAEVGVFANYRCSAHEYWMLATGQLALRLLRGAHALGSPCGRANRGGSGWPCPPLRWHALPPRACGGRSRRRDRSGLVAYGARPGLPRVDRVMDADRARVSAWANRSADPRWSSRSSSNGCLPSLRARFAP
jgi:fructose-1,6-bisphosphatase/inositol monophosphatase family enzyme